MLSSTKDVEPADSIQPDESILLLQENRGHVYYLSMSSSTFYHKT